jgi:hypothetical protein
MTINYGQGTPERTSRGYVLFITATVMVIVSGLFVMARMGQRYKSQLFGWDDYTIAFSLVSIGVFLAEEDSHCCSRFAPLS